ncbi:MAG: methionyl-tRNA formyltransferase [bacterium]|nr:methionyl-tRNA formyltransferase [bacterium]
MENDKIKIIFIGTPEFGAIILEKLVKNNYKPVLVITNPDKPAGRKQVLTPTPVKLTAQKYKILVEQPEKIQNSKFKIQNLGPDLIITAAYGQIIPKEILKIPKYGCLNVHPSLLPKYRGPSPIQTAILNGDKKTGLTVMLMDEKMDHGKIISNFQFPISNKITYQELYEKLALSGAKLLLETIPKWIDGKIKSQTQDEKKATYTKIIKKEDGKIDWKKPAQEIERQIRALNPWPGTFTFIKKRGKKIRIKVCQAELSENNQLIIKKLQPEGKKPMSFEDFKKGYL